MKRIHFTQEQVTNILEDIAEKDGGYQEVLKISLEAIMRAERAEHNKSEKNPNRISYPASKWLIFGF